MLLGDSNNRGDTNWAINFLIFPSKYKPCLHSHNQGRKHSLPGMMILWFLKEVHMDKSEYNYLQGVGITMAISVLLFNFFSLFLAMLYNVLQIVRKTARSLSEEQLRSTTIKRINSFEDESMSFSIRNKRVFINYSHCSFVFAHIIQHFGRHQDRSDSSRWFDSWSDAVENVTTLREKLYPAITTREKQTGKPWAEARTDKQWQSHTSHGTQNQWSLIVWSYLRKRELNIIKARGKKGYISNYTLFWIAWDDCWTSEKQQISQGKHYRAE